MGLGLPEAGRDAGAPRASESLRFLDTVSLTTTPETAERRKPQKTFRTPGAPASLPAFGSPEFIASPPRERRHPCRLPHVLSPQATSGSSAPEPLQITHGPCTLGLVGQTMPPSSDDAKPAGRDAGAPRASESLRFLDTVSLANTPETAESRKPQKAFRTPGAPAPLPALGSPEFIASLPWERRHPCRLPHVLSPQATGGSSAPETLQITHGPCTLGLVGQTMPPSSDDSKPAGRDAGAPRASEPLRFLDTVSLANTPETAERRKPQKAFRTPEAPAPLPASESPTPWERRHPCRLPHVLSPQATRGPDTPEPLQHTHGHEHPQTPRPHQATKLR